MAVTIRLKRVGRRGIPRYRIVATPTRSKRDGRCLENLGTFDARNEKGGLTLNVPAYEKWVSKGAQPSGRVAKLYEKAKRESAPAPA
ncbi:MAG: 30S ribosomal protein S16 [Nitrospirae bacterium]|nr:30S ribosomal protein S16 [Nitrospirota bacterium]